MAGQPDAVRRRVPRKAATVRRPGGRPGPPPELRGPGPLEPAGLPLELSAAPVAGRFGHGWRIVADKELADHVLSARSYVLIVVLGLAALAAVYAAASGIRGVADRATGSPALFLKLLTIAPQQVPAFYVLVGLLGPLLGVAFGFDAVSSERSEKTLPRLLAQPIHRDDVVNGKFAAGLAAVGGIMVAIVLFVVGIGLLQLGTIPSPEDIVRLMLWLLVTVVYIGLWLAFATLCSVVVRRAATAALIAISVWLVLTLFGALLAGIVAGALAPLPADATLDQQIANASLQQELSRISPATIYAEATEVLLDPSVRSVGLVLPSQSDRAVAGVLPLDQSLLLVWPEVVALVAETSGCFAVAYVAFMRQEVRA